MSTFKHINLLKKTSTSYRLLNLENREVNIPDLVLLYQQKYTKEEIQSSQAQLVRLVETRLDTIRGVLCYLLDDANINILYISKYLEQVDIAKSLERYNNVLAKGYENMDLSAVEDYLFNKYDTLDHTSFTNKELIESEDFMFSYLMSFVFDYKCNDFFNSELIFFFSDMLNEEKKKNDFFSFLYFQYEYYFFLDSINILFHSGLKHKRDESFIKNSIYTSSMLLNVSFSQSNKGLYHSSNDLSSPFLGFLELHIRDLFLLLNNPETNTFSFFNYVINKYGDIIYPFCIRNDKGEFVFHYVDNMIDFSYMHDFVNSYMRYVLNTNSTLLHGTLVGIKNELSKGKSA
jgi:hypothetical protein